MEEIDRIAGLFGNFSGHNLILTVLLQKVDWTSQSASVVKAYRLPLWYLRFRKQLLQYGSQCKQIVRKLIYTMQNEKYKSNY